MITNTRAITYSSYLAMLFLGVGNSIVGAAARNIGLTPFEIGLLITVQNIGFTIAVLVTGILADRRSKSKILFWGSLILSASFLTFYLGTNYWLNLGIMLLIGAGTGTYEGVTDALLLELHKKRANFHININHLFVTIGSGLITGYLLYLEMDWRRSMIQAGGIVLLLAVVFAFTKLQPKHNPEEESLADKLRILVRHRSVVILFLLTAVIVGVEIGTLGILTTYLMELRRFTQFSSKIGLLVFLAGVAAGRLVIGTLTRENKLLRNLKALFGSAALVFLGLYFIDLGDFTYPAIFLAGITISAMLPLVITLAGLLFPDRSGTVIGTIKVAIPIGGILIPFIMSMVARYASLQASLLVFPLAFVLALGLTIPGISGDIQGLAPADTGD